MADNSGGLGAAPALRVPGAPHRPQAATADQGGLQPQRPDEQHDDRALQRLGSPAREVVRPPGLRARAVRRPRGGVRDIGVQTAMYGRVFFLSLILTSSLATALVYGWGGVLAVDGRFEVHVVALAALLTRLYGPLTALSNVNVDVMTALVSFDRVFEVLDLAPLIAEQPDAVAIARGRVAVEFDHVDFSYPTAEEVSLASLESVAVLDQTPSSPGPLRRELPCRWNP